MAADGLSWQKGKLHRRIPQFAALKIVDDGEKQRRNGIPAWRQLVSAAGTDRCRRHPFLRKVLREVTLGYKIDENRMYLNGFSNGGQMAAKCSIENEWSAGGCVHECGFILSRYPILPTEKFLFFTKWVTPITDLAMLVRKFPPGIFWFTDIHTWSPI